MESCTIPQPVQRNPYTLAKALTCPTAPAHCWKGHANTFLVGGGVPILYCCEKCHPAMGRMMREIVEGGGE